LIKANGSIVAVQWATSGFGALAVMPTRDGDKSGKGGRLVNPPLIEAHKTSLQDFDISPYDEHMLVTSDGGAIKIWKVPEGGLSETMREAAGEVKGDACKRLSSLNFHPTSENLLSTCGKDFSLRLFDINQCDSLLTFGKEGGHSDIILSTSWSLNGSLVATGCKDKFLRIGDPRAGKMVLSTEAHPGAKGFTATWLGFRDQILTAGFTKNGERQLSIWDFKSFSSPLHSIPIDTSPGIITPYYDPDTEMVFLLGRGDNTIRYYEINDDEPHLHYLDQFRGTDSQADITPFAKRLVDVSVCEVARFAKLTKDKIEHVMFQVPRKDTKDSLIFHEDLYKYVPSGAAATSAKSWLSGATQSPPLLSAQQLMPTGFQSIYNIDSNKKADDERREEEKRQYQAMSLEERALHKDANSKRPTSSSHSRVASNSGETGDKSDDEDDLETLAKFSSHSRQTSLSAAASSSSSSSSSSSLSSSSAPKTPAAPLVLTSVLQASSSASSAPGDVSSPRQGKHKLTLDDGGSTYDGTYKNDQKHGNGVFTHKTDVSTYDGAWVDDKRAGKGTLKVGSGAASVSAQGTWIENGLDLATAVFTLADGSVFEFVTVDGSGKIKAGKLTYKDGETYEGAFSASTGKRHGVGVWCGKDGGKYEGEYKDDLRHGKGDYHYPDGSMFKGNWKLDLPDGDGVFLDKSGKVITGTWSKGKLNKYTVA
jgi:hypothetical protein